MFVKNVNYFDHYIALFLPMYHSHDAVGDDTLRHIPPSASRPRENPHNAYKIKRSLVTTFQSNFLRDRE